MADRCLGGVCEEEAQPSMLGDEGTQRQIREHDGIVGIVSEEVAALLSCRR
jgi:hypothetical protein